MNAEAKAHLRAIAEAATPGPWRWFGGESSIYLATVNRGRRYIMDFVRRGMAGAQPRFQSGGIMHKAEDLATFEVASGVVGFKAARLDGAVYRCDINGISNPDATYIAAASPEVVLSLLKEIEDLRKRYENWRPISEEPVEQHRSNALIHFYVPGLFDDCEAYWSTRTWSKRPNDATHWCLIVSPLGPHGDILHG